MVKTPHKPPDFKSRLTLIRKEKAGAIPGFGAVNREGQRGEKLNIPVNNLDQWFADNED